MTHRNRFAFLLTLIMFLTACGVKESESTPVEVTPEEIPAPEATRPPIVTQVLEQEEIPPSAQPT